MCSLVSIITPVYNCEEYIDKTIESVLSQTYENWEMIIVDDCSTDNTKAVLQKYLNDPRIKYVLLEENSGAAVARTKAMELAEGEFMAFLDSDDIWYPQKLQVQLEFMKNNNILFSCTAYEQIDQEGRLLGRVIKSPEKTDYDRLLLDCPVGNSTVMYNVCKLGKFKVPNIRKRNDDALWLTMLKKEKYIYSLNMVLAQYRIRENSISSGKLSLVKYHWKLYREIEHLSVLRSVFHICFWGFLKVFKIK